MEGRLSIALRTFTVRGWLPHCSQRVSPVTMVIPIIVGDRGELPFGGDVFTVCLALQHLLLAALFDHLSFPIEFLELFVALFHEVGFCRLLGQPSSLEFLSSLLLLPKLVLALLIHALLVFLLALELLIEHLLDVLLLVGDHLFFAAADELKACPCLLRPVNAVAEIRRHAGTVAVLVLQADGRHHIVGPCWVRDGLLPRDIHRVPHVALGGRVPQL